MWHRRHKRILGFLKSKSNSMLTYNIPRDKLADAKVITPGGRSPTISPLDDPAWCSVTVLVPSKRLANVMDQLEVRSLLLLLLLLLWPWIDIWFSSCSQAHSASNTPFSDMV